LVLLIEVVKPLRKHLVFAVFGHRIQLQLGVVAGEQVGRIRWRPVEVLAPLNERLLSSGGLRILGLRRFDLGHHFFRGVLLLLSFTHFFLLTRFRLAYFTDDLLQLSVFPLDTARLRSEAKALQFFFIDGFGLVLFRLGADEVPVLLLVLLLGLSLLLLHLLGRGNDFIRFIFFIVVLSVLVVGVILGIVLGVVIPILSV